jgi:hypothetical protein
VRFVRNKVDVSVSGEICVDRCLCVTARIAGRVKITFYSNIVLDVSGTATASAQAKKCPGCPWELSYELCLAVSLDAGVDAWIASTWGKVSLQACYSSRRGFYALVSYEVGWSTFWDSDKYGGSTCLYGNCP